MKQVTLLALLFALASIGCGHKSETVYTGADGSKALISQDNNGTAHIEGTDANGTKVTEDFSKGGMSIKDSKGDSTQINTGSVTEDILGLPFYPGSEEAKSGSMISDTPDAKAVVSSRTTKDDPDQVAAFYKDKLTGVSNSSTTSNDTKMVIMSGKTASGADTSVMVSKKGSEDTAIMVSVNTKKSKS